MINAISRTTRHMAQGTVALYVQPLSTQCYNQWTEQNDQYRLAKELLTRTCHLPSVDLQAADLWDGSAAAAAARRPIPPRGRTSSVDRLGRDPDAFHAVASPTAPAGLSPAAATARGNERRSHTGAHATPLSGILSAYTCGWRCRPVICQQVLLVYSVVAQSEER